MKTANLSLIFPVKKITKFQRTRKNWVIYRTSRKQKRAVREKVKLVHKVVFVLKQERRSSNFDARCNERQTHQSIEYKMPTIVDNIDVFFSFITFHR